ncbi:xylose isomerase [Halopseudomonas xiamenensis]|uniref:xylose isomerase n=1 Tax=Halopseudomonas xiamenensis TaxID=157792 RepID=UPI001626CD67|nr:xylose isomerase [Halopseudomonas xiamenensis]
MKHHSPLLIGCNGRGVQDSGIDKPVSLEEPPIEEQFRLVGSSGEFDFFDRLPLEGQQQQFLACMDKYNLPVHTTSWLYQLGNSDHQLASNLRISSEIGASLHNMMVYAQHADGHMLSDQEVVDAYLWAYDQGMTYGVEPCFELHVNMWSEDPRRITPVAEAVRRRGVPFNLTLDYSHVIFKIGNPEELSISGIQQDVEANRLTIDPFESGNLVDEWLEQNLVRWFQVRSVAPNGPRNIWARHEPGQAAAALSLYNSMPMAEGDPGRGILYPFTRPAEGEWHSPWHAYLLEPTREVVRKMLRFHRDNADSRLQYITTEMITLPDYALNARFSLLGQNEAIARFIRDTWEELNRQP